MYDPVKDGVRRTVEGVVYREALNVTRFLGHLITRETV